MISKPGRIAYVITDLNTGGVPLHLARLAVAVRDRGNDPHVISLAPPGPVSQRLRKQGVRTYTCQAAGPKDVTTVWKLASRLREVRPRIVHSFLFHANVASRLAMRLAGLPPQRLICEIQTAEIERRWHLTVGGMTHRMGPYVVGNAPSVVEHLRRCAHIAPSRLRCIPGGVDVNLFRDAVPSDREALNIPADAAVVLWVGRLDPVKGLDELIQSFAIAAQETNASLLLAGDGPYAPRVERLIAEHELEGRVRLLGARDDIPNLLRLADVFTFPSYTEGLPNALLEAMAAARPIVTTDVPGCRDLITHEDTGLLVPPRNAPSLAEAINRLLNDHALAERLGNRAAASVAADYTFDRCVDRYMRLYEELDR